MHGYFWVHEVVGLLVVATEYTLDALITVIKIFLLKVPINDIGFSKNPLMETINDFSSMMLLFLAELIFTKLFKLPNIS